MTGWNWRVPVRRGRAMKRRREELPPGTAEPLTERPADVIGVAYMCLDALSRHLTWYDIFNDLDPLTPSEVIKTQFFEVRGGAPVAMHRRSFVSEGSAYTCNGQYVRYFANIAFRHESEIRAIVQYIADINFTVAPGDLPHDTSEVFCTYGTQL